jgi:hypothetical protein
MRPSPLMSLIYRAMIGTYRMALVAFKIFMNVIVVGALLVAIGCTLLWLDGTETKTLATLLAIVFIAVGVLYMWKSSNRED